MLSKLARRTGHFVIAFAQVFGCFVKCNFINQSQSEYCHLEQADWGARQMARNNKGCEERIFRVSSFNCGQMQVEAGRRPSTLSITKKENTINLWSNQNALKSIFFLSPF